MDNISDEIVIVPLRELSYDDAKREIIRYIQKVGNRKVYISEIAEQLRLDIELIMQILREIEHQNQPNNCDVLEHTVYCIGCKYDY